MGKIGRREERVADCGSRPPAPAVQQSDTGRSPLWCVKIGFWGVVWLLFPVWAIAHSTYLMVRTAERRGVRIPRWLRVLILMLGALPLFMFVATVAAGLIVGIVTRV